MANAGLFILGLVLLFAGGEALVRGAVWLARRMGLPPIVIGLTVVGFGTSTPELLVSLEAALQGAVDIAVGNVVGSNTANILLVLGISALIFPMATNIRGLRRDSSVMVLAASAMVGLGVLGIVGRTLGAIMLALLAAYIFYAITSGRRDYVPGETNTDQITAWKAVAMLSAGLALLIIGADTLISSSTEIARLLGVSERVIGLTIVAVGTSLPELATSAIAAFRRNSEIAIGNIVGSNIFNVLGILGVTAVVRPLPISHQMAALDIPIMFVASVALVAIVFLANRLTRTVAAMLLTAYAVYVILLF